MKSLIAEGRKLQESFNSKVVNEESDHVDIRDLVIYDNGGKTHDRYTIYNKKWKENGGRLGAFAMSENPTHPLGFSQYTTGHLGSHNGRRIPFEKLPLNVQNHVKARMKES